MEYIQINHNHIGRTFNRCIIKSKTIKSATLILLSKVGLGRTFGFGGTPIFLLHSIKNKTKHRIRVQSFSTDLHDK